jgi:hypothetical protein
MRVAKNIGDPDHIERLQIITNCLLVDDDYDFLINNKADCTSIFALRAFYGIGRMNYGLFRKSLKTHILPNYETLTADEKKELLFNRVIPENYDDADIIAEVGLEGLQYMQRNISDVEEIENLTDDKLGKGANEWQEFEFSTDFTEGDYILIEDASSGYAKRRISKEAFAESITGGFGQFSAYDQSIATSSTTSTTFVNKLTLITDPLGVESTYRIAWALQITNNGNNRTVEYRVTVDGTTIDITSIAIPRANGYIPAAAFHHIPLSEGSHTISIDYRAIDGGTVSIQNVRLEFWRAAEDV